MVSRDSIFNSIFIIKKSGKFVRIVGETFSEDFETSYLALSKCKFWANEILGLQKGFQMNSSQTWLGGAPCSKITVEKRDGEIVFESHFVNEVEGIIKASEWILNENS